MRGQVTIEFILVLVIVLVILATISLPTIDRIEQDISDVGTAASLAANQQQIVNAAEELSLSGCGSRKTIRVFVNEGPFAQQNITWTSSYVNGSFFFLNGTAASLRGATYPDYINITAAAGSGGYWPVTVAKNCNFARPTANGCIGYGC